MCTIAIRKRHVQTMWALSVVRVILAILVAVCRALILTSARSHYYTTATLLQPAQIRKIHFYVHVTRDTLATVYIVKQLMNAVLDHIIAMQTHSARTLLVRFYVAAILGLRVLVCRVLM
jgi:hypothetical protein